MPMSLPQILKKSIIMADIFFFFFFFFLFSFFSFSIDRQQLNSKLLGVN